jgi:DNA-directed RNA polymerase specialized sigma24 family protein
MPESSRARIQVWIERLEHGDEAALNEMLDSLHDRFVGLVRKMFPDFPRVRRSEKTSGVINEAVARLIPALKEMTRDGRIRRDGSFHTIDLLRLVARHMRRALLDLARKRRGIGARAVSLVEAPPKAEPFDGGSVNPVHLAEWTEFHSQVEVRPVPVRDAFDLIYCQGLKQVDAAAVVGLCDDTVRDRYQKARLRLHEKLRGRIPGR